MFTYCRCTCPDFVRNRVHCKHILFILVKVLKLSDPLWYQAAFLSSVMVYSWGLIVGTGGDFRAGGGFQT